MKPSDRQHTITFAAGLLLNVHTDMVALSRVLRDSQAGYPSGGSDGRGGTDGSQVERLALAGDRASADNDRLDRILRDLEARARELAGLRDAWLRAPRLASAPDVGCSTHGCDRPSDSFTDARGRLSDRRHLCDWCRRWWIDTGSGPNPAELEQRDLRGHVRRRTA